MMKAHGLHPATEVLGARSPGATHVSDTIIWSALRAGALAVLLGVPACHFDEHGVSPAADDGGDDDDDDAHADARLPVDAALAMADASPADAAPPGPFCDSANDDLRGCWRFEGPLAALVVLSDESGWGNDGVATQVERIAGPPGHGDALQFHPVSSAIVPESMSLDVTDGLTIDMWIHPDTYPVERAGLLDDNNEYALFLDDAGGVRCIVGGANVLSPPVALGVWTHVACTYDLAVLRIYIDGREVAHKDTMAAIPTQATDGIHLGEDGPGGGDELDGAIDDLRVWSVARSAVELCHAADRPSCP
jgi:hypothetical protein